MATWRTRSATFLGAAALACGGAGDGAGSSDPDSEFGRWTLGASTIRIGGSANAGGAQLTDVLQVIAIGDHSVALRDSPTIALMLFDSTGTFVRNIGRRGEGPGEFMGIASAGRLNDSVWVSSYRPASLTFFSLDGAVRSSRPLASASVRTGPRMQSRYTARGLFSNGKQAGFIGLPHDHPGRPLPPSHGGSGMLALFEADSIVRDTLMWLVQASSMLYLDVPPHLHFPGPNYFANTPLWHVASDGSGAVVIERPPSPTADPATYRVTRWNGEGKRTFAVDVRYTPVPVSQAAVDTAVNFLADDMKEYYPSLDLVRQMVRDSLRVPPFQTPASDILVGSDGAIWIAREGIAMKGHEARRYDVLDDKGRPAGIVELLRPGRIMAATGTAVWIVETDDDDVPALVRYPLNRKSR